MYFILSRIKLMIRNTVPSAEAVWSLFVSQQTAIVGDLAPETVLGSWFVLKSVKQIHVMEQAIQCENMWLQDCDQTCSYIMSHYHLNERRSSSVQLIDIVQSYLLRVWCFVNQYNCNPDKFHYCISLNWWSEILMIRNIVGRNVNDWLLIVLVTH